MIFSRVNKVTLLIFLLFVLAFEILHIQIGDAPSMPLRIVYIGIYLFFCLTNIKLIPVFTTINLIIERFSTVYGEFLPNTLYFHIVILLICYFRIRKPSVYAFRYCNSKELSALVLFASYVMISGILYAEFSTANSLIFAFLFIAILNHSPKEHIQALINCIIISMTCSCLLSFMNFDAVVADYMTSSGDVQRMAWKDSNYLSFFIGVTSLLALFKIRHLICAKDRNFYRVIAIILLISLTLLISRGAVVALAAACLYYYKKTIFSHRIIGLTLAILLIGGIFYYTGLLDGFIMRFDSESMETGSGRTNIWEAGFNTFLNKGDMTILFGAGDNQASKMAYLDGIYFSPHNNFIEVLFNFGYVGLSLFLIWWISMFIGSKTKEKRALIIFIMTNSMTIVPLSFVMPVWIVIPVIMIWDKYANRIAYE